MWIEPICNRTQGDIDTGTDRGFCNAADLNRLEDNCVEVAALLGLALRLRGSRWYAADMPTESELDRVIANISLLSGRYMAYQATPQPPKSPLTHWGKWNDAERILLDIRSNYMDNRAARSYSGELSAGERIGIL